MHMDPTSALLVALLFDGLKIISEKSKGGVVDDYYKERIEQMNRNFKR